MNSQPALTVDVMISEPAAVAGWAVTAWAWYYDFTEARLVMRGVVHH